MNTKQVIVIRKDLKMRRGKEIAQGSHASIAFLTKGMEKAEVNGFTLLANTFRFENIGDKNEVIENWLKNSFTKICLCVNSEEELDEIFQKATDAKLMVHLIIDKGLTEFNGVPTKTCLAIGPDISEEIDKITGNLKLY
jgi:PTH2 family peptidyl-tRNA hydrolase